MWGGCLLQRHTHTTHTQSPVNTVAMVFGPWRKAGAKPRRDNMSFCFYVSRSLSQTLLWRRNRCWQVVSRRVRILPILFSDISIIPLSVTTDKRKRGVKYDPVDAAPWYDHSGGSMLTAQELLTTSRVLGVTLSEYDYFTTSTCLFNLFHAKMKLDVKNPHCKSFLFHTCQILLWT